MSIKDTIIPVERDGFFSEPVSFRRDRITDRVDEDDWRYQVERWFRSKDRESMEQCLFVLLKMVDQLDELDPNWKTTATGRFPAASA